MVGCLLCLILLFRLHFGFWFGLVYVSDLLAARLLYVCVLMLVGLVDW